MQRVGDIHIICTSREEHDIKDEFGKWLEKDAIVPLQQRDVDTDIGAYVSARLETDWQLRRWQGKPQVQNEIRENLIGAADGM